MGRGLAFAGLAALLVALPLRAALLSGEVPGAGPDVISTLWGFWWFQARHGVAGGWTDLVNFPNGAIAAVLSPSSALLWSLLEPLLGAGRALSLVAIFQLSGFALATALLARRLVGELPAAALAGLSVLVGRYLLFGLGEGSLAAVVALPLPLGLWALVEAASGSRRAGFAAALCMAALAWENPYLGPVLPGIAALMGLFALVRRSEGRIPLALALGLGTVGLGLVGAHFSAAASPDYPREVAATTAALGPFTLPVVDLPWSRVGLAELLLPGAVRWTESIDAARSAGGGRYLGLSVLGLAGLGLWRGRRAAGLWGLLTAFCLLLAGGSLLGDAVPGPFLVTNAILGALARPFTQPSRFLAVALVGLAMLVAHGLRGLPARVQGLAALGLLTDALLLGGPSLTMPTLRLPAAPCVAALSAEEGGVVLFPADVGDGDAGPGQLLQLLHGRPAAHRGIASWRLHGAVVTDTLRKAGLDPRRQGRVDAAALAALGYRHLIVEGAVPARFSSLGAPAATCEGYTIYALPSP